MDVEVTKISQLMNDLFRRCKRKQDQSVREFNVEFERLVLRLHEVRCELPPLVKAWLYVDKLRLSEQEELALLASVGNEYDVRRLQHAALVQDRTLRHGRGPQETRGPSGPSGRPRWRQSVHMTVDGASSDEDAEGSEASMLVDEETAIAEHTAYMTYQGAKAKYKESLKGRGADPSELKRRAEERLRLAKQRSYCSACKRRGHWHKDPECPLKGQSKPPSSGTASEKVQQAQVCHTVQSCYMTQYETSPITEFLEGGLSDKEHMLAIVDTACTKSVAGYQWFEHFIEGAEARQHEYVIVDETEHFKFGASRVYKSTFAIWAWFGIAGHWVAAKISIVQCQVPLLLSRPALAELGTTFDIEAQELSMARLGVQGLPVEQSDTGHPAVPVTSFPSGSPPVLAPGSGVIWIPISQAYMSETAASDHARGDGEAPFHSKFYPKKVPKEIENLLQATPLASASFYSWWKGANQSKDFWIETPNEMLRIHVSPRQFGFNPWKWNTVHGHLKTSLVQCLDGRRITECIPVLEEGTHVKVFEHAVKSRESSFDDAVFASCGLWIGRSRFTKANPLGIPTSLALVTNASPGQLLDLAMEDAQRRDHQGVGDGARSSGQPPVAAPGVAPDAHRGPQGDARLQQRAGPHEGHHPAVPGGAHRPSQERGHRSPCEGHERLADSPAEGVAGDSRRHCGPLRQVQGLALPGAASRLPSMGSGRGQREEGGGTPGLGSIGVVGPAGDGTGPSEQSRHQEPGQGPGGIGDSSGADPGGAIGGAQLGIYMEQGIITPCPSAQSVPSREEDFKTERHGDGRLGRCRRSRRSGGGDQGAGGPSCCPQAAAESMSKGGESSSGSEVEIDIGGHILLRDYVDSGEDGYKEVSEDDGTFHKPRTEDFIGGHAFQFEDVYEIPSESEQVIEEHTKAHGLSPRDRAKAGIRHRKRMNEGAWKRLHRHMSSLAMVFMACSTAFGTWAEELIGAPVQDAVDIFRPSQYIYESSLAEEDTEVQCLELFAGQARISEAFARRKRGVLEPKDLRFGHDFRQADEREAILRDVALHRPRMTWLAPPCTYWCGFSKLNYSKQELRRLRAGEQVLIEFVNDVLEAQHGGGRLAVVENPRNSDLWRHPLMQRWILQDGIHLAKVDLCGYGLVGGPDGAPLKKPLSLMSNSETFSSSISRACVHQAGEHRLVQGKLTAETAVYPTSFASAVVRAFDQHRRTGRNDSTTIFTTGTTPADEEAPQDKAKSVGADAISFKGKVNPTVAAALKRIHQNLGHPCNRDLVKHLRLGGAPAAVLNAAQQMTCRTCERSSQAKLHKMSAPVTMLDFNEAVAADVLWVDTVETNNHPCLNLVDLASTYQVVVPLPSTKSEDVAKAFVSGWVRWAGAPKHLLIDLDSAFKDSFLTMLDERCIVVRAAAGQAHWQNAVAERHGATWKLIWAKLVEQKTVVESEIEEAAAAVSDAKNGLRNKSGYSPRQWVFGCSARDGVDIFDGDHEVASLQAASADSKFARAQVIRTGAKAAFFECQSKDALARAVSYKPRVASREFEPGELVYLYRESRQGKSKKPTAAWTGPAVVIGREGSNYWLARGGRCLLAAPEHVREAKHEEVSEMLRLKVAMKEIKAMAQADGDEYEEVDDHDAPGPEVFQRPAGEGGADMEVEPELEGGRLAPGGALHQAANREELIRTSMRRAKLLDDVPVSIKKARLGEASSSTAFMARHCLSAKGKEKQLEKELPWGMIPPQERPLYLEAEDKQWQEHMSFGAVKPLSVEESKKIESTIDPSRILRARFAYKDKNHSKRKTDPSLPCKAKARLCVAGHHDPDLGVKDMTVDAPTACRHSILLAIQLAMCRSWHISVGDIRAAFLNGVPAPRQLYFRQPRGGIRGLEPSWSRSSRECLGLAPHPSCGG